MREATQGPELHLTGLSEGVVLLEGDRVIHVNPAAARMLGIDAGSSVGRPIITVLRNNQLERVWTEGRDARVAVRGRRLHATRIPGGIAIRDVEDQVSAREDARRLLAVLSHELRTPVTTIQSTLEALAYDDLPRSSRDTLLERARQEVARLVRLIDDLTMDVAPPRQRSVALEEVAERAHAVLAALLQERSVRVRREIEPGLIVWADPDKLMQVLLNLLENAALHGPSRSEVVLLASSEGAWARVAVRDQGTPLPQDAFARLFTPGRRGSDTPAKGTGLGLYVVRSMSERWGGKAWGRQWFEAGEPGGNEFGVTVPLKR